MQITTETTPPLKKILKIIVILIPVLLTGFIISDSQRILNSLIDYTYETQPDPDTFITANYSRMFEMAAYYDERFEQYHIPLNMSASTIFADDECTIVSQYHFSDNTGQWTGLAITGWIFKYLTAQRENDDILEENALRVIKRLFHGMKMQLAVPNGGIGPEYGGILARGWADPASRSLPGVEWYFTDAGGQHHNGTGVYSNYRWRSFTSNDEYTGFYSGLGLILKYILDPEIQMIATLMIDQITSYMLNTNLLGIDWHGGPTGVHQRAFFFQGGLMACLLLKIAALALPEKYESIYYHYAAEEMYAWWTSASGAGETIANYYAFAFNYHMELAILLLEDKPGNLRNLYIKMFQESLWSYTNTHRNPFYNMIYLGCILNPGQNSIIERDCEDILMRYDCEYHFPDRMLGHATPPPDYEIVDLQAQFEQEMARNPFGFLYRLFFSEINFENPYYNKPLTPEYRNGDIFMWERNPFVIEAGGVWSKYEYPGISFSLVYWMGRFFEYFPASGVRDG